MPRRILHFEGFVIMIVSIYLYSLTSGSWLFFLLFLFVPDLFMLGYLINKHIGAIIYNVGHTYILAIILASLGLYLQIQILIMVGLIWGAHIGMDRMIGYGLKYPTGFKENHLQKL